MVAYRESVQEYMRASEAILLKADELADYEREAVEAVLVRLGEAVRISGTNSTP
jgi:hypothetical protein